MQFDILTFKEHYMERLWGGQRLKGLGRPLPEGRLIGEAWLVADHLQCESVVKSGALAGTSLRDLMEKDSRALLGSCAQPSQAHRFPLLLKLIDAGDALSVQVHPDDEQAQSMGEQDRGKTEMWHILEAAPGSRITSGMQPGTTREDFTRALGTGDAAACLRSFPVSAGDSVFVPAGSVHAIGGDILLAEIQQNSDITYRLFDWNRVDAAGRPRELHVDKALEVTRFDDSTAGRIAPLRCTEENCIREYLCACRYFSAEKVFVDGVLTCKTKGSSFHIVQALDHNLCIAGETEEYPLQRGEAALVPACVSAWQVSGQGTFLEYYVPDFKTDIVQPLLRHGYGTTQIASLGGGDPDGSLRSLLG